MVLAGFWFLIDCARGCQGMGYISSADQKSLGERYKVTALVVGAMGLSAFIFLLVPKFVRVEPAIVETINWTNLLYTASLLTGLAVILTRRMLLSGVMLRRAVRQGSDAVLGRLSLASIICAALGEAVGILGLIGYLMTGESYGWPVGIIALILITRSFPIRGEWARALETTEKSEDK